MGRRVAKQLSDISDIVNLSGLTGEGLIYNGVTAKWNGDLTIEKTTNKNISNGYAGLDVNGDIDAGVF